MKIARYLFAVLTALIAGSAYGASQDTVPALSVTAPNGQTNVLMGTLHVADGRLRQPDPSVLDRMRLVVFEHPGLGTARPAREVRRRSSWSTNLTRHEVSELRAHLKCRYSLVSDQLIEQALQAYLNQPTEVAANQLAYDNCDSVGYLARDTIVEHAAQSHEIPRAYLESDAEVRQDELNAPVSDGMRSIRFALSSEARALTARVVDALNEGDYDTVAELVHRSLEGAGVDPRAFDDVMIRQRNEQWMKVLPELLDQGRTFVLVGAAHLPGRNGLVAMLRKRGYSVIPIELQAGSGS